MTKHDLPAEMDAADYVALMARENGLSVPDGAEKPKRKRKPKPPTSMTEAELQRSIVEAAEKLGYRCHHETDSRKSKGGFPDLHIVGHSRQMVLELKSDQGESRPDQRQWIKEYQSAGVDARFVYPEDLDGVLEELRRGAAA